MTTLQAIGVILVANLCLSLIAIIIAAQGKKAEPSDVYNVHGPYEVKYWRLGEHTQKVVCAWCGKTLKFNHGCEKPGISHGMCSDPACKDRFMGKHKAGK